MYLQLIELWETFLMQLDADEDGEPFYKPPAISPAPILQRNDQQSGEEQPQGQQQLGETLQGTEGETEQGTAATATIEQEE